jgi:hypothetical protein
LYRYTADKVHELRAIMPELFVRVGAEDAAPAGAGAAQ